MEIFKSLFLKLLGMSASLGPVVTGFSPTYDWILKYQVVQEREQRQMSCTNKNICSPQIKFIQCNHSVCLFLHRCLFIKKKYSILRKLWNFDGNKLLGTLTTGWLSFLYLMTLGVKELFHTINPEESQLSPSCWKIINKGFNK